MPILTAKERGLLGFECPFLDSSTAGFGITPPNLPERREGAPGGLSDVAISGDPSTGLHVHCDYLRFIGKDISEESFKNVLAITGNGHEFAFSMESYQSLGRGTRRYDHSARTAQGVKVLYSVSDQYSTIDYAVDISGKVLSTLPSVDVWRICLSMSHENYGAHCSRFDIAVDDYKYKNMIGDCIHAIENNQQVGIKSAKFFPKDLIADDDGDGLYLGSRRTERFVRVYEAESLHGIDAIRWEQENKGRYARNLCQEFVKKGLSERGDPLSDDFKKDEEMNQILSQLLGRYAVSNVSFKDKTNQRQNGQVSDLPNVPFWQAFIDRIGGVLKIVIARPKTTVEKKIAWLERSGAKSLAVIRDAIGGEKFFRWIQDLWFEGGKKLDNYDLLLIKEYRRAIP